MRNAHLQLFQDRILHISFSADASALTHYIPKGMEAVEHEGKALLGLSGSLLSEIMYKGIRVSGTDVTPRIAFYTYIRDKENGRVGAVLLDECYPRKRNSFLARFLLGTRPAVLRMDFEHRFGQDGLISQYRWERAEKWNTLKVGAGKDIEGIEDAYLSEIIDPKFYFFQGKKGMLKAFVEHQELKHHPVFDQQLRIDPEQLPLERDAWQWNEPICAHSLEGTTVSISKPFRVS